MCMYVCEHVHVNMCAQMCMCVWRSEGSLGCYTSWACPPCSMRKGLLVATVHWSGEANWLVSLRDLPFSTSLVLGWRTCPTMPGFSTWLLKTQGHHASTARAFLAEPPSQASCSLLHADESAASVIPPSLHQQTLSVHRRRSIRNAIMSNGKQVQTLNVTSKEMMTTQLVTEQWKEAGASEWQCRLLHFTKGIHWGSSSWIGPNGSWMGPDSSFCVFLLCHLANKQTKYNNNKLKMDHKFK